MSPLVHTVAGMAAREASWEMLIIFSGHRPLLASVVALRVALLTLAMAKAQTTSAPTIQHRRAQRSAMAHTRPAP
jgi:hypothetical protein